MNEMTRLAPGDTADLWQVIEQGLARDGDFAVRDHLAAGFPVYYSEADTPAGLLVRSIPTVGVSWSATVARRIKLSVRFDGSAAALGVRRAEWHRQPTLANRNDH